MVNEIGLEEVSLDSGARDGVTQTPYFSDVFGSIQVNVTPQSAGSPAPIGTLIQAFDPRGQLVGMFQVTTTGTYGYMRIYGEDTTAVPTIPGMRAGELVSFKVNGVAAAAKPSYYWQDDHLLHQVDLVTGEINQQAILLSPGWNLISFYNEPPSPLLSNVLQSINSRYDRVLSENGVYASGLDDAFITLKELHTGQGYYLRTTGTTSVNLLIDGIHQAPDTPIQLHKGWNWIGYLPSVPLPITDALTSIAGKYQMVHSMLYTYNPADPVHSTLSTMQPGEGYLIYMNEATALVYPATGQGANQATTESAIRSIITKGLNPTPNFMTAYGEVTVNNQPAPVGTIIQVYTQKHILAGVYVVETPGVFGYTHIFGDLTYDVIGFTEGEELTFFINGLPAKANNSITWTDDKTPFFVTFASTQLNIFLPVIAR